jgi:hypothetical protein
MSISAYRQILTWYTNLNVCVCVCLSISTVRSNIDIRSTNLIIVDVENCTFVEHDQCSSFRTKLKPSDIRFLFIHVKSYDTTIALILTNNRSRKNDVKNQSIVFS